MTEYWVSQKKHWCDYCKCWLNDTPAARAFHERGLRHQQAVKARLREMRKGEESQKQDEKQKSEMMERIEAAAAKQYAKDVELMGAAALSGAEEATAAAAPLPPPSGVPPSLGCWELQPDSKLYYNAKLRFYYDKDKQWYYGGDPPDWTQTPGIPEAAKYDQLSALEKRAAQGSDAAAASTAKGLEVPQTGISGGPQVVKVKKVVRAAAHPMQAAGGHSMPLTGRIGAAKGAVPSQQGGGPGATGAKRPRDGAALGAGGKKLSKEELEHQARREAARARVAARTAASFGLE